MEIKINIPKNDYKEPTEVRQDVVQSICDHIIWWLFDQHHDCYDLFVDDSSRFSSDVGLYMKHLSNGHLIINKDKMTDSIRIRGCEMQAVFDVMWDAGYYISGEYNTTQGEHTFHITYKANKYDHYTKKFAVCID